jgi:hypothetical protein
MVQVVGVDLLVALASVVLEPLVKVLLAVIVMVVRQIMALVVVVGLVQLGLLEPTRMVGMEALVLHLQFLVLLLLMQAVVVGVFRLVLQQVREGLAEEVREVATLQLQHLPQ